MILGSPVCLIIWSWGSHDQSLTWGHSFHYKVMRYSLSESPTWEAGAGRCHWWSSDGLWFRWVRPLRPPCPISLVALSPCRGWNFVSSAGSAYGKGRAPGWLVSLQSITGWLHGKRWTETGLQCPGECIHMWPHEKAWEPALRKLTTGSRLL